MTEQKSLRMGLSAFDLKLMAMVFMLCDHMWATIIHGHDWLACIGRLAFPIFAFQIAEGYAHTRDAKAYRRRLLLWALISEIPFNLMTGGGLINPFHQNVLFTFWLALLILGRLDRAKRHGPVLRWAVVAAWTALGYVVGFVTFVDYYGYGIFMVVLFHLTREVPWSKPLQLAGMVYINVYLMKGLVYPVELLGREWLIPQQGLALLALVPIWLYNGRQGVYNKTVRRAFYAFYPAHILILALIGLFILN